MTAINPLDVLMERVADRAAELVLERLGTRPADAPLVLTVERAAALIDKTPVAVRKMIQRGQLRCVRDGRRVRIPRVEIDRYLERLGA